MICQKYANYLQAFTLSGIMTFIMSLIITIINVGFIDNILLVWMHAWIVSFAIAFPAVLVVLPFVRKFVIIIASKENCK